MNEPQSSESSNRAGVRNVFALVLFGVGLFALADRHFGKVWDLLVLPATGMALLIWSLAGRIWALLIPGCIILGLGAGVVVHKAFELGGTGRGGVFLICMAAGWFLLTVLSAISFKKKVLWPLIPGGVLAVIGTVQLAGPFARTYLSFLNDYWPIIAIALAVLLLLIPQRRKPQ